MRTLIRIVLGEDIVLARHLFIFFGKTGCAGIAE